MPPTQLRFFGIPAAGKKKWMKALNLTPSSVENPDGRLNISHLLQLDIPEIHEFWHIVQNEATSPLTKQPRPNFFFDIPSSRRSEERRISRKQHHRNKKSHKKKDGKCWFCLSTCVDEKHLVISVGNQAFLALAKGPIIKEHVLITTLEHRRAVRILDEPARKEIEKYKKALMKYFMPYRVPIFYERACKSSHLQVHCVPIPNDKVKHLVPAAKELAFKYELEVTEYPNTRQSFMCLPPEKLYFHIEVPNGVDLLIDADDNFPLHFGRELLVMRNLLNLPEKKSWRHCIQSKEIETKAAEEFKNRFEKFDFNLAL
uniref:Cwf19-like C-terminal domain-containing protein n=1 Tax=Rhodnius prolixus TaxID=13249 RepID=T1HES4_RHOPR